MPPQVVASFADEVRDSVESPEEVESAQLAVAYFEYNRTIIDAIADIVPAVKPQIAMYEALGPAGVDIYTMTCEYAAQQGLYVLGDIKRGDIGSTAAAYAHHLNGVGDFDPWHEDAVTVNPYLGTDGITPFVEAAAEADKDIFVLVRTSNPSSSELQMLDLADGTKVYEHVADLVEGWGAETIGSHGYSRVGAVVGATHPEEGKALRERMPHTFFLVPGYGAQGGDNHINLYEPHVWKHHTKVAGLEWKNPVGTASGTFQYAAVRWFYDVSQLGAVCTKGASPVPWEGNPSPRTAESPAANINAVGLQNPGIDHYLAEDLPKLKAAGAFVISNVAGHCDDDYAAVVEKLADSDADMLEINVSCPNVSAGGMSVGTDPVALANLMDRLRPMTDKPMIVKLTPNVTDITVPARAAVEHGADALSMINTLKGMRINIRTGKPIIANVTGGVSGPAVLPVGLAAVYRVRPALPEIPIIGLGGIDSGEKALEYLYAGANAVEVGAAALFDPVAPLRVARELDDLLDSRPELAAKLAAGQTWR